MSPLIQAQVSALPLCGFRATESESSESIEQNIAHHMTSELLFPTAPRSLQVATNRMRKAPFDGNTPARQQQLPLHVCTSERLVVLRAAHDDVRAGEHGISDCHDPKLDVSENSCEAPVRVCLVRPPFSLIVAKLCPLIELR